MALPAGHGSRDPKQALCTKLLPARSADGVSGGVSQEQEGKTHKPVI